MNLEAGRAKKDAADCSLSGPTRRKGARPGWRHDPGNSRGRLLGRRDEPGFRFRRRSAVWRLRRCASAPVPLGVTNVTPAGAGDGGPLVEDEQSGCEVEGC